MTLSRKENKSSKRGLSANRGAAALCKSFDSGENASMPPIVYSLSSLQVATIDAEGERNVCPEKRHYGLIIY